MEKNNKQLSTTLIEQHYQLGLDYSRGRGESPLSEEEAERQFLLAAHGGHSGAAFRLGLRHEFGIGQNKRNINVKSAIEWYKKAATFNYPHKEAKNNNPDAVFDLAVCHAYGVMGEEKNHETALHFYEQAAKLGNSQAMLHLGQMHLKGEGTKPNINRAVKLFQKASKLGHAAAEYNLGYCYQKGYGVSKSDKKAVQFYAKAVQKGDADAEFNLGVCYQNGIGVEKHDEFALELFNRAAQQGHANAITNISLWEMAHSVFSEAEKLLGVSQHALLDSPPPTTHTRTKSSLK